MRRATRPARPAVRRLARLLALPSGDPTCSPAHLLALPPGRPPTRPARPAVRRPARLLALPPVPAARPLPSADLLALPPGDPTRWPARRLARPSADPTRSPGRPPACSPACLLTCSPGGPAVRRPDPLARPSTGLLTCPPVPAARPLPSADLLALPPGDPTRWPARRLARPSADPTRSPGRPPACSPACLLTCSPGGPAVRRPDPLARPSTGLLTCPPGSCRPALAVRRPARPAAR
ncbi:hypothetical protein ACFQ2M_38445 [Kitasatospora saccharophila]|uniref:hypothetical protein n=1 Tax=Kitasatospora saccharophila TaxID=407973 RepID=UPI0036420C98